MANGKKPAKGKQEVTKREEQLPVAASDYADYAGKGFQNQTQEDIAIPFINVLQSNSPEVEDKTVEGAESGMLINSVTKELFETLPLVPAVTRHRFIEWVPRSRGGGLVGFHAPNSEVVKKAKASSTEFGKYTTEDGNDLVETFEIFGVPCTPDGQPLGMAVVPFAGTKIKSYKHIMGRLNAFQMSLEDGRRFTPPMYSHLIEISTIKDKNEKGTFYKTDVKPAVENDVEKSLLKVTDPRFQMAAELEKLVAAGQADADWSKAEQGGGGPSEDEQLPF